MLVSVGETADVLGVSDRHIRKMVARGVLPHYRIGRAIRIDLEEAKSACRNGRPAAAQTSATQENTQDRKS